MNGINHKNNSINIVIASVLVAFFIDIKCLNSIFFSINQSLEGSLMSFLYIISVVFILIWGIIIQKNKFSQINLTVWLLIFYICVFYLITIAFIGSPNVSITLFSVFTISSLFIPSIISIDVRLFTRIIMILPTFGIFFIKKIFIIDYNYNNIISMGQSYAFLIPIIATIVYIYFYYNQDSKREKIISIIAITVNLIYFIKIFQYGSRGPILSVILLLLFLYVVKEQKGIGIRINKMRLLISLFSFILISLSFNSILSYIFNFLGQNTSISLSFIEKSVLLSNENDITNGRINIINETIDGIKDKFMLGHGLDRFYFNTGLSYPHNFLLQILYDGGLFFAIIILLPIIKQTLKKIKSSNRSEYILMILLFFSSIPGAFFSMNLWENGILWIFFGSMISNVFTIRSNSRVT